MAKTRTKGLVRSLNRGGVRTGKTKGAERRTGRLAEPAVCARCGAVLVRRAWHRESTPSHAMLARARWIVCPACIQVREAEAFGRIRIAGDAAHAVEAAIRRRIANVAALAASRQPERRLVSVERQEHGLEVRTTSQKLAHRIVHELKKAFGGRATYTWSDDGSLDATWTPRAAAARRP